MTRKTLERMNNKHGHHFQRDGSIHVCWMCGTEEHRNGSFWWAGNSPVIPDGYSLVPIIPTEGMVINGFESEPDPHFSDEKEWAEYEALSGCRKAARRAELCWAAMIKAAPKLEVKPVQKK
ncbi:hypothetical protein [Citrobacter farmeri]|uniref:hypothetical protein n=1 Tax=Citrobacter farmeri TaxID=67824 RepID=UPI001F25215E|nr:hypothetical protein [Citrobacter farmeri]